MDDANVAIRLKGFIDSQDLSHSQFADKCEIPRPSLSQILSGRNKKVSDVIVGQIHRAFPQLSILWLLFGEGKMIVDNPLPSTVRFDNPDADGGMQGQSDPFSDMAPELGISGSLFSEMEDEGRRYSSENSSSGVQKDQKSQISRSQISGFPSNGSENEKYSNVSALKLGSEAVNAYEKQIVELKNVIKDLQSQIEKMKENPRGVSHITVYYDDSKFETFYPKR